MTMQQFSVINPLENTKSQMARRNFLIMAILCFVFAFIFICTVVVVVLTNIENKRQHDYGPSYSDLKSQSINITSLFSLIQPSTPIHTSPMKTPTLGMSPTEMKATSSFIKEYSSLSQKTTIVSTSPSQSFPLLTTYKSNSVLSTESTTSLIQNISLSSVELFNKSSSIFLPSTVDFTSIVLPSVSSSLLTSSHPNTTTNPPITLAACPNSDFTCRSGECVSQDAKCNRYIDCQDKSDEENCTDCIGVQCTSGLCLWSWSPLCDGIVDCFDLSDEVNCVADTNKRKCDNGVWIYKYQWCDGIDNCYDNSDEKNCSCLAGLEIECGDGQCIRKEWVCDAYQDCSTDEMGCDKCSSSQYICQDYSCIDKTKVCDGSPDCPQGEEETQCFKFLSNISDSSGLLVGHYRGDNAVYPVCSTNWKLHYSNIVCRYMGHEGAVMTLTSPIPSAVQYLELSDNVTDTQTFLSHLQISFNCRTNRTVEITCMTKVCGKRSSGLQVPFISGGDLSTRGRWPWVVSLSYLGKPICSGVLINPLWVLTAGHCMAVSGVYNYTHTPNNVQVLLGSVKRTRDLKGGELLLRAVEIRHHPDMKWTGEGTIYWDIALIRLERPVTFTAVIQPICLSSNHSDPVTSTCYLTGWGSIEPNQEMTVEYLREAKLRVWDEEECRKNTIVSESTVDTNFTLCAGYTSGTLSGCRGDSGSGLMCMNRYNQWSVEGVMSSGAAQCGVPSSQALRFTKVSATLPWIHIVMSTVQ
ncbi:atrial natriuretic peptide-converting enzyme-like [Saccostrea echinata]|uniref:atrial natriuretic peptide-converting enzyme-like n=1 Tax=Saccostrea echinata TaxID=191078 RepID=UPI002A7F3F4F|nr:atrial natriuretic peptide-converting enzyme-like [Saccostrea echinata]